MFTQPQKTRHFILNWMLIFSTWCDTACYVSLKGDNKYIHFTLINLYENLYVVHNQETCWKSISLLNILMKLIDSSWILYLQYMVFGYCISKCTEYNKTNYISTIYIDITHCVNKMFGWSTFVAKKKFTWVLSREKILITIYRDIRSQSLEKRRWLVL